MCGRLGRDADQAHQSNGSATAYEWVSGETIRGDCQHGKKCPMKQQSQLDSLRRVLNGTVNTYIIGCIMTMMSVLESRSPYRIFYIVMVAWIALYGFSFWYGSDHDSEWWDRSRRAKGLGVKHVDVFMIFIFIMCFMALPIVFRSSIQHSDPMLPLRGTLAIVLLTQTFDAIGFIVKRYLAKDIDDQPIREYFRRYRTLFRIGINLATVAGLLCGVSVGLPLISEQFRWIGVTVTESILFCGLAVSETTAWRWRLEAHAASGL